jgi:tetratricopeptide (TPR) repeat protein
MGRSAVYTGKNVIDRNHNPQDLVHFGGYAGHVTGKNFSVQGNTLASEEVVKAMAAAYESTKGTMADRLLAALDAGQSKGGDTRGMESAGLLVVRPLTPGDTTNRSYVERVIDLRVDDAITGNPFKELRRLLDMQQGVPRQLTEESAKLAAAGKFDEAIAKQKKAIEIDPNRETYHYGLAQRYAQAGDTAKALQSLEAAIKIHPVSMKREAAADPIFAKLKDSAKFKQLIAK